MQKVLVLLVLFVLTFSAIADQPPQWNEFTILSTDKTCFAHVAVKSKNGKPRAHQWSYQIRVYKKGRESDSLLWSCDYVYDGYAGGVLSDDGSTFVYARQWYEEDRPLVFVYQHGVLKKQLSRLDLGIDASKLIKTASHRLWLENPKACRLIKKKGGAEKLQLRTVGKRSFEMDLRSFALEQK
ncbi:hypothetical protein ACFL5V_11935 [Fibrobacterota bacterium]